MEERYRSLRVRVKRYLQSEQRRKPWVRKLLASHIFDEELWQWHRDSVAKGVGWGAASAIAPLPMQSIWGILACLWRRGNIPVAVLMAWLSPPGSVLVLIPLQWWFGWWLVTSAGLSGSGASVEVVRQALGIPPDSSFWDMGSWQASMMSLDPLRELNYWACFGEFALGVGVSVGCLGFVCYLLVHGLWSLCTLMSHRNASAPDESSQGLSEVKPDRQSSPRD